MEKLHNLKTVSILTGKSLSTIYRWIKQGKIIAVKVQGEYRVREGEVLKLRESEIK